MTHYRFFICLPFLCCLVALSSTVSALPTLQYPLLRWHAMNCPLGAVDLSDCAVKEHDLTVFAHAAPGVAVAVLVALAAPVYLFAKYALNCCGGRRQSPNFCFPLAGLPGRYDKCDLLRPVVLAVVVFGLCLAASVRAITAQRRLNAHVAGLNGAVRDTVKNVEGKIAEMLEKLTVTLYNATEDSTSTVSLVDRMGEDGEPFLRELAGYSAEITRMLNDAVVGFFLQLNEYAWVPYVLFILSTIVSFVGMMCAMFNYRRFVSMCIFLIMALLAIFAWVCNGMYATSFFFINERCHEISEFTHRRANIVKVLTKCNDTSFGRYNSALENTLNMWSKIICKDFEQHCRNNKSDFLDDGVTDKKVFDCSPDISCSDVTDVSLVALVRDALCLSPQDQHTSNANNVAVKKTTLKCQTVPGGVCDLSHCLCDCMENGVLNYHGKLVKSVSYAVSGVVYARSAIDTIGSQLGSCDAVLADVIPSLVFFCKGASDATNDLMNNTGLLGVALLMSLYAYGIGAKRFIPFKEAFLPQND